MESFRIDGASGRDFTIGVEEVQTLSAELIRTLIEIDLQTFAESTFSNYTAAAFLTSGRVYLLRADDIIIGTCVCMRCWDRPNEAMVMSMGIRPGWRGQGLGQRFVLGVLDRLRGRGLRTVSLLVGADNRRAIKVYRDVGFSVMKESEVDARNHDRLLHMRAQLVEDGPVIELRPSNGPDE